MSDNEPRVLAPRDSRPNVGQAFGQMVEDVMHGLRMNTSASEIEYADLDSNVKGIIDETIERLKPEIQAKSEALITEELRDRLAKHGNMRDLSKALAKNKIVSLKRKKGCIYLQFGSGEPTDPIEEFLILMT